MIARLLVIAAVLSPVGLLPAQERTDEKPPVAARPMVVTPEREAAVFAFVDRHHAELAELLKQLKENRPKQYERAVRELYLVSERLARIQESDPDRHALELKAWKIKSRVQLLSARLTMSQSDELKRELRSALAQQYDVRREMLLLEQSRMRERLAKIDQDLADLEARRDAALEKQFQTLTTVAKPKK